MAVKRIDTLKRILTTAFVFIREINRYDAVKSAFETERQPIE